MHVGGSSQPVKWSRTLEVRRWFHRQRLGHYLSAAAAHYAKGESVPDGVLSRLHLAWGNEGWSAGCDFLSLMIRLMRSTTGPVLECGSGLSSLLGAAVLAPDRPLVSLEHEPTWLGAVQALTPRHLVARFPVRHAPLVDFGSYDWYQTAGLALPASFGLVICDGPPGSTRGGRYGLAPVMRSYLRSGTLILLDDTQREQDRQVAERWCAELPARIVEEHPASLVLKVET